MGSGGALETRRYGAYTEAMSGKDFTTRLVSILNRKVGQRTMDNSTLVAFIQHFDEIPLSEEFGQIECD